jgi:hypothetical protein
MAIYLVQVPTAGQITMQDNKNAAIVSAVSSAEAILVAKAYTHWPSDAAWAAATATALVDVTDLENYRLRVEIDNASGVNQHTLTYTAASGDDFDDLGAGMAALGVVAGLTSTYSTPNLQMAAIGDGIGDHTMRVTVLPPASWDDDDTIPFPSFVGSITHEGVAGAILNVVLLDVIAPTMLYQVAV